MSRQGEEPERQMVPKRPRREDQLVPRLQSTMSIVPHVRGIDLMPTIRGVHEHTSTWMSCLINAQDGCLQAVAQRASMGRTHQEHLAQQVALRSTMPSTNNEVAWLRAQLALRDAQIEQVKAQRDSHFVHEEAVLAHMRLLSSEAKDWKSRVVTEAEEVLCRESAHMAHQATEAQEAMGQHYKAKWQQAETDLKALCKSNSAQVQSFASKMHETNAEHQKLHDAQERRIQLEAQALRDAHQHEQQAAQSAQEYQDMVQALRRQADDQPDKEKLLWTRYLSQQADYRAEIHELHTELLNMKERSEMKSHLAADMCRIEQTVPSRTVEAEPDNVLNTLSPGRSQRWILPHELETPNRPTSSGLQSPVGAPIQLGPSPMTREYPSRAYSTSSMGRILWSSRRWWLWTTRCSTGWRWFWRTLPATNSSSTRWVTWCTFSYCTTSPRATCSRSMCQWDYSSSKQCWRRPAFHGMSTKWSMCPRRSSIRKRCSRTEPKSRRSERQRYQPSTAAATTPTCSAC